LLATKSILWSQMFSWLAYKESLAIRYITNRKCTLVAMVIAAFWDSKFRTGPFEIGTYHPRMQQSP
jgi:hypothetical protein